MSCFTYSFYFDLGFLRPKSLALTLGKLVQGQKFGLGTGLGRADSQMALALAWYLVALLTSLFLDKTL